jgi:hypothetical protein
MEEAKCTTGFDTGTSNTINATGIRVKKEAHLYLS